MVPKQCTALAAAADVQQQQKFARPTTEGDSKAVKSRNCSVGGIKGAKVTLGVSVSSMEVAAGVGARAVPEPDQEDQGRVQQNQAQHPHEIRRVYFTVGARHEEALFYSNTPAEQIKDLFRAAAEASPRDILKLYSRTGQLLNINASLEPNTPSSRFAVQAVAAHSCAMLEERAAVQLHTLEARIADIERQLKADPPLPDAVRQLQRQVDAFRDKLETTESLSWLGFNKQLPMPLSTEDCRRLKYRRKSDSIKKQVKMNFANICDSQVSDLVREDLRMPSFDSTQWEDEELLWLLQQMYLDFDLCSKFAIDIDTLRNFLYEAYKNYNEVPFHNFRHCFCVAQMMYAICWAVDLPRKIGDLEVLILLTSCICHDLDHPGYNNIYQINAKTELALRYNDISPLENHHCSVAFRILENEDCNLFKSFTSDSFKVIREGMIRSILATDMARHNEILTQFKETIACFDYDNKHHVNLLCMVLIKVSDISNEARPMDVAEPWLDKLLMEFYKQSDAEKLEGLPVTPFMDRDRITKPSSQCSFIGFVLLPLFETLAELLTELQDLIVQPVRDALDYYKRLNEATKEERLQRKSIVAELSSGGDLSPAHSSQGLSKSGSNLRLKKSLSFQTNRSRSRSSDTEDMSNQAADLSTTSPTAVSAPTSSLGGGGGGGDDPPSSSLCLLPEDDDEQVLDSDGDDVDEEEEDSETNTVTEVEASEKALKFKISTEAANSTSLLGANSSSSGGRKSYPGSRKGSRERVVISATNQTALQQQQQHQYQPNYRAPAKLQKSIGTLSFDHQYASSTNNPPPVLPQQQPLVQEAVPPAYHQKENVTGIGPTAVTTSLALDRRGSTVAAVVAASGGGGVVGMLGGRLVFGGGGGGSGGKAKAGAGAGVGGNNNVCISPPAIQSNTSVSTSSVAPSPTSNTIQPPTLSPPPPTPNPATTHTKRTTNFLLKTLKRQNSNKTTNNKSNNVDKNNSKDSGDHLMVNIPLDQEQEEEKAKEDQQRNSSIQNNFDSLKRAISRGHSADRSSGQQQSPNKAVASALTKKQKDEEGKLRDHVGARSASSGSFLARFKHFTCDRLGLLSSTGALDKTSLHDDDGGDGGGNAVQPNTAAHLKSNNSNSRMTLPLIYRRKRQQQQHQGRSSNDPTPTTTTCCNSMDNVESTSTSRLQQQHNHHSNNRASTLPKARRLGAALGSKKHWKMFLLRGSGGGGSKATAAAATADVVSRDEEVGGGEAGIKAAPPSDRIGGWSSDCDVAIAATADDSDKATACPASTSQCADVTTLLKNNQVTTATTIGGGGEDVHCCRTRPTKSPPPPPPLPPAITVAPSLSGGGNNNTAPVMVQPQAVSGADIVTM